MKIKILAILIILIALGVGGFFVYKNMTGLKVEKGVVPAPAAQVRVYKGTWTPTFLTQNTRKLASNMRKMKEMGMNTVFFQGTPPQAERCLEGVPPDSRLAKKIKEVIPIQDQLLISNIQTAHRNGLKVALTVAKCMPAANEISREAWNSKVVEYAKLAEKHQVEFFAPMNEPEALFGPTASATWGQEILPKIREVYHGKVIWKGGSINDIQPNPGQSNITNFSGYDYLGLSIGVGTIPTMEEFSQFVDSALDRILVLAERDNCEGVMISEFYGNLPVRWEERAWNEEKEARANEIILERGKGRVVGFFALDFLGLSFLGEDIPRMPDSKRSLKTEEVIKKYFTEVL